jgi:hypothetical protein
MHDNQKPHHYTLFVDDEEKAVKYFQSFFGEEFPILTATDIQQAREIMK